MSFDEYNKKKRVGGNRPKDEANCKWNPEFLNNVIALMRPFRCNEEVLKSAGDKAEPYNSIDTTLRARETLLTSSADRIDLLAVVGLDSF